MIRRISFVVLGSVVVSAALHVCDSGIIAADLRVLEQGKLPADSRLGEQRTYDDKYHPWNPPSTKSGWELEKPRLRERMLDKVWRRTLARRGYAWLGDALANAKPLCPHTSTPYRSTATAMGSEDPEGAMLLGTGSSLAAQLEAIDSQFVKDILAAAPSFRKQIESASNHILSGSFYKALKDIKKLMAHEEKLLRK